MSIWHEKPQLELLNQMNSDTLGEQLGMKITTIGDDFLAGTMPVDKRTVQPYGILHGGASVALAETLGSIAAHMCVDPKKFVTVGMEINANHLRPAKSGIVTGTAKPIHLGKSSHVWTIEIKNEKDQLVCISRLTMAVVPIDKIKP